MKQTADKEFVAMRRIIETLQAFDGQARERIMFYVTARVPHMGIPELKSGVPVVIGVGQPVLPGIANQ